MASSSQTPGLFLSVEPTPLTADGRPPTPLNAIVDAESRLGEVGGQPSVVDVPRLKRP
jgi:hypothetical protein